jgi:hypothetical protein
MSQFAYSAKNQRMAGFSRETDGPDFVNDWFTF